MYENIKIDPEYFPLYMPERRGYAKLTFMEEEKDLLIHHAEEIAFFEIKSKSIKRFKKVRRN